VAILIKTKNRGKLRRKMGIPAGQPIPAGRLQEELHSKSEATRKEAQFAENAKGWNHSR
jgi:hypothetical protein